MLSERSLRRISSDLHDGPGQMLSLALLRRGAAAPRRPASARRDRVRRAGGRRVGRCGMRCATCVRSRAGLRLPELEPMTAREVVQRAIDDHVRRSGTPVALTVDGRPTSPRRRRPRGQDRALPSAPGVALECDAPRKRAEDVQCSVGRAPAARSTALRLTCQRRGPGFDPSELMPPGHARCDGPRPRGRPGERRAARWRVRGDVSRRRRDHRRGLVAGRPGVDRAADRRRHRPRRSDRSGSSSRTTTRSFARASSRRCGEQPGLVVVGEAGDAAGALALAREHLPDVAVLDVAMPGGGLNAARDITVACPATRVVMLTVSEDEDDILAAMKAGASGYVLKGSDADERRRRSSGRSPPARSTSRRRSPGDCCARCRGRAPRRSTS